MKKELLKGVWIFLLMMIIPVSASAQIERGFRMGVQVNAGISRMNEFKGNKASFGYGLGWIAEYNFNPSLFLQSGVGLENIAYKDWERYNVFYGQVPIHVGCRHLSENGKAFFVQAGPTIGVGLWGSDITLDCYYPGGGRCDSGNYFEWHGRRFELGLGGRVGMEIKKFQISVGANYGVTKATKYGEGHNLSMNLGVGYMF